MFPIRVLTAALYWISMTRTVYDIILYFHRTKMRALAGLIAAAFVLVGALGIAPEHAGSRTYLAPVGLVYLAMGLLVLFTQDRASLNYNLFGWFVACFIICFYTPARGTTGFENLADFIYRTAIALFAPLFFHFCARFPLHQWMASRSRRLTIVVLYVPAAELIAAEALAHFTPNLFSADLYLKLQTWLDAVALLQCALFCAVGLLFLFRSFIQSRASILRQQLIWIISGLALSIIAIAVIYFEQSSSPIGVFAYCSLLLTPLMVAYSIIRYRLTDVDLSMRRSLIHLVATAAVGAIYVVLLWSLSSFVWVSEATGEPGLWRVWVAAGAGMLLMAFLLVPFRNRIQEWAGRLSYGERYALRKDIQRFGRTISQTMPLPQLLDMIARRVCAMLLVEKAAIFIADSRAQSGFRLASACKVFGEIDLPDNISEIIQTSLSSRGYVSARDLSPGGSNKAQTDEPQAELYYYISCIADNHIVAILAVGHSLSGALLTIEDMDLLKELSGFIAVAIHNSLLHKSETDKAKELARKPEQLKQMRRQEPVFFQRYSPSPRASINVGRRSY